MLTQMSDRTVGYSWYSAYTQGSLSAVSSWVFTFLSVHSNPHSKYLTMIYFESKQTLVIVVIVLGSLFELSCQDLMAYFSVAKALYRY